MNRPAPTEAKISVTRQGLKKLRRFALPPARRRKEYCELCGQELAPQHDHLIEPKERRIVCSCVGCALLFSSDARTVYRRVPRDAALLQDFRISDADWDDLCIPIGVAFIFRSSVSGGVVAVYPSPAGAIESQIDADVWEKLTYGQRQLERMQTDVEALLVNRLGEKRGFSTTEYYLSPIDECYKLVGLLRTNWRGLAGGPEVWSALGEFFAELRRRSTPAKEAADV